MEISIFPLSIPFSITNSDFSDSWSVQLYVKVKMGETVGWGETGVFGSGILNAYSSVLNDLILPFLENREAESPSEVETDLEKIMFTAGNCGVVTGAISSVEMALWDIKAKELRTSLSNLVGGKVRERVPAYGSFPRYSSMKNLMDAVLYATRKGFDQIKLHQSPSTVEESLKEIREKIGFDLKIALDINAPFDLKKAKEFSDYVSRYEIEWIEEPIWPPDDYDSLSKLCEYSSVPIAAGENEYSINGFKRLLQTGISYLQPDIAKIGGVSKFLKVIDLASSFNVSVAPHDRPDSSLLSLAYTLQIASARPEINTIEYTISNFPKDLYTHVPPLEKGEVAVPSGVGVGVDIIEESLKNYTYTNKIRILPFSDLETKMIKRGKI
ncbi:mandelate racemase/muconate lactonizing enzyme family protein [Metallosphaera tengchongensis]|uniref:Mandelate racemase/muconate lactonizing enzyme family protein n=1 Tax=Metallosphaera tengchongensis TaxID=1532350 RepID=A0A6N0NXU4_9CREN|nr:mandelate racemase/muconate lactonizing enzyme family protein [Metallosphaera tengchongensis]QKR00198.1 mandelate racemase/muconate lactonizing enzyme family protein [Metallosphaera tengchongensis]